MPAPSEDPITRLEKIKQAAHLKHVVGLTWDETAKATGFTSPQVCQTTVSRYMKKVARDTERELEPMIAAIDMRYDAMRKRIHQVLAADHPVVQNGVIIRDDQGRPLKDAGPVLAALNTWLSIEKSWSATHGTDASKKLEIALEKRSDLEANLISEAVMAGIQALGLEPAQRMIALEAAAARLEIVDAEVVEDPGE
jgi:hypothetical protein